MAATVIAVSGKGGVGKTALAAALVRYLTERYPAARLLAVDADPAGGLSGALGVEAAETLDDVRRSLSGAAGEAGAEELGAEARFRLLDALAETRGFAFLAIGRPEAAGCYCAVNTLLKQAVGILADGFDYVVIDAEAGVEQINRRVMERVTHLLLVTDQSRKGCQVIETIRQVAERMALCGRCGAVLNRVTRPGLANGEPIAGVPLLAVVAADARQTQNDARGRSVFELPEDAALLRGADEIARKLEL